MKRNIVLYCSFFLNNFFIHISYDIDEEIKLKKKPCLNIYERIIVWADENIDLQLKKEKKSVQLFYYRY